ncbi:hypothetical protein RHOSPDRAFT_10099, partial [Rhodotorula sp. JG-1b]
DTRTQLFVSNLPFRVRWQDLKDLMRKCGTVLRADVALNPADGRSRGFGVVLFAKAEDAAKAIATYHGYTWQTRVLDVRIDAQDPTGMLSYYSSLAAATNGLPRPESAPPIAPNGYVNLMGGAGAGAGGPPGAGGLQYQNRHLFIGNLPFNCQWQELKDLMRGAGNVLRADIAQGPDGRSRGFGSVLFATPQDAERAVALFN